MSTEQKRTYATAFLDGIELKHMPLYVGMVVLLGISGYTLMFIFSNHATQVSESSPETIARLLRYLMYLYVTYPFVLGLGNVYSEWRAQR